MSNSKNTFLALNQDIFKEWVSGLDEIVAEGKDDIWSVSEFNIMMIAHPCINPTENKRALRFIFEQNLYFLCVLK